MTTLAELVAAAPAAGNGVPTQLSSGTGVWRWVIELADPAAGAAVEWFDITEYVAGVDYTRGADEYHGRYRAAIAELELQADDDSLAPWNEDTSATFGVHVELGAGLIIRAGLVRVVDDTVAEWLPRFTQRVETWRDATFARGQIRQHRVTTRDLLTELVGVPIGGDLETNWYDRAEHVLTEAGWSYGWEIYGAQLTSGAADILTLPTRPEAIDAIVELDATFDPAGVVWRTNRKGQLVAHPMPGDTFHADAFTAGATGTPWVDSPVVAFAYTAELDGRCAYVVDSGAGQPFGVDDTEVSIKNHLRVTDPTPATYDIEDPVSIQRYGRKTLPLSWIVANDDVADVILSTRATSTKQASPLQSTVDLPGYFPAVTRLDPVTPMLVAHETGPGRDVVTLTGRCRQTVERFAPRSDNQINWSIVVQLDVDSYSQAAEMLPVTGLTATSVNYEDATFGWSNPAQTIVPTETWVRIPQQSLLWLELDYPMTALAWLGLTPSTPYQFDVRLVRRVDGLVTNVSPVRSTTFVTDPSPAPVVDTDDDGGLIVDLPDVDDPEACVVEWVLESTDDGTTWTEVTSGEAAGGTEIELAPELFEAGLTYRVCSTEVCDEIPGTTYCSPVVVPDCVTGTEYAATDPPWDSPDLRLYVPEICSPDVVVDAVSGIPGHHGPAWGGVSPFDAGDIALLSATGAGGVIAYGETPNLAFTGSATIGIRASVQTHADSRLLAISGLRINSVDDAGGWYPQAQVTTLLGDEVTVTAPTTVPLITPVDVRASYDTETGVLRLEVAGVAVAEGSAEEAAARANAGPYWYVAGPAASWFTDAAVWSGALISEPPPAAPSSEYYGVAVDATPDTYDDQTAEDRACNLKPSPAYQPSYQAAALFGRPALRFTGANSGFQLSTTNQLAPKGAIVAASLDSAAPNGYYSPLDFDNEGGVRPWQFRINPSNKLEFVRITGGVVTITGATTVTRDTDHTFGWSLIGTTLRIYLDGVQDGSGTVASLAAGSFNIAIGFHQFSTGTYFWDGDIGEVFLWETVDADTIPDAHDYITGA